MSLRRLLPPLFVIALALMAASFIVLHIVTPSDGARLAPGPIVIREAGIVLTPMAGTPDGLQAGDVVVTVAGRSIADWTRAVFSPDLVRPRWQIGQQVDYTIIRDGQRLAVPVTLRPYPLGHVLAGGWGTLLFSVSSLLVALMIVIKRSADPAARLLPINAVALLSTITWSFGLQVSDFVFATGFWLYLATSFFGYMALWSTGLHFALIFPRPLPVIRRNRWLLWLIHLTPPIVLCTYLVATWLDRANVLHWIERLNVTVTILSLLYLVLTFCTVVAGYRLTPDPVARSQIRWIVWSLLVTTTSSIVFGMAAELVLGRPLLSWNVQAALGVLLPITIAFAMLRYRLFDIDIVINRTLVYGTLSLLLAAVYFGGVVVVQAIVRSVSGQQESDLAVVASTLAVAGLVQPLRQRLQTLIDRRFYRSRYDAGRILQDFGDKLRDEVDLNKLRDDLLAVVEDVMQPSRIELWLRPSEEGR